MAQPFQIAIPDAVLGDLKRRLAATRLPSPLYSEDTAAGLQPEYLSALIEYWREGYDWRAAEAKLNRFHQFLVESDATQLHFIHERGAGPRPLPLLLLHGYPDSCYRFAKLIPLLIDPAAHGGSEEDSFDVVAPSLPGYAFSTVRADKGGLFGFGHIFHTLMTHELGYERFAVHGGDWGSTITEHLARSHHGDVLGIHMTDVPFWHALQPPHDLRPDEQAYLKNIAAFQQKEGAYAMIQGTRPRALSVGLTDSPAGLAAWIVEKFQRWSDCDGAVENRFSKDELLTNLMLYWVTDTAGSSLQPYHDVMSAGALRWMEEAAQNLVGSSKTPAAFAMFPKDLSSPPRSWAERFFNVQRWTEMSAGGHFAALEEPEVLVEDIRSFFRPLRTHR